MNSNYEPWLNQLKESYDSNSSDNDYISDSSDNVTDPFMIVEADNEEISSHSSVFSSNSEDIVSSGSSSSE